MLNVACFVQSRLTDADFVIFSNYCLIGTRHNTSLFYRILSFIDLKLSSFYAFVCRKEITLRSCIVQ